MSFTWPEIPFTGAEVEAFVTAYKQLAEAIYNDWDNDPYHIYSFPVDENDNGGETISRLKAPFRRKATIKILLEYGLVYAAFIVKQRAGNSGPGTDFDLGNSPLAPQLSSQERLQLFKDLGCVFTKEAMECAYGKNNGGKSPPTPIGPELFPDGNPTDDPDPDDQPSNDDDPPEDCPDKNLRENFYLGLANIPPFSSCYRDIKGKLLDRYLSCNDSVFTKDDLGGKYNSLKNNLQEFMNSYSDGEKQYNFSRTDSVTHKRNITSSFTAEQKARMGAGPTDIIWQTSFYGSIGQRLCLHTLFGNAIVITNSSGTVLRLLDDFDFVYGNEADRPDASYSGQPNPGKKPGLLFNTHQLDNSGNPVPVGHPTAASATVYPPATTVDELPNNSNPWDPGEIGRNVVGTNYVEGGGKGQPVPININFE